MASRSEPIPSPVFDIVGVGFGPANLALAIAVEEHNAAAPATERITARFVERQPEFGWHRGMLIDGAVMQVSFLKDLATMRNPTSTFGFVPYLYSRGRLADFINHKILFPTREEFHDYLSWAANRLSYVVRYGTEAVEVRPPGGGSTGLADVVCRQVDDRSVARAYRARNIVFAPGLRPTVPSGVVLSERVWHSSQLLYKVDGQPASARRFVVVGAGQSAAECTEYLHRRFPAAEVCAIFTRYGYSPADDSPFANRIFDPDAVGEFFNASKEVKAQLMGYHRSTNYSVVDVELIEDLYRRAYRERIRGEARLRLLNASRVTHLGERSDRVRVGVRRMLDDSVVHLDADAVVFATGYAPTDVGRLLGELNEHCVRDPAGRPVVTRDYRIRTTDGLRCGLYLQGGTEHTHGLTSSLLSNVAVRAGEIFTSILARRGAESTTLLAA